MPKSEEPVKIHVLHYCTQTIDKTLELTLQILQAINVEFNSGQSYKVLIS